MSETQRAKHTLLILHGITATKGSVAKAAPVLQQSLGADALVVPDLPHHGRGERLEAYDVPEMLEWLDNLLTATLERTDRVTVVAHSYSAALMLYWSQRHAEPPGEIRLVAVAPPLRVTRTALQFAQALKILPKRVSWHTVSGPMLKPLLQSYISTYPRRKADRDRIFASTKFDDNDFERYVVQVEMNEQMYSYVQKHPVLEVHQPTLVLLFGKDLVVDSQRLSRELTGRGQNLLSIRYIEDSGHLLISQDPERLVEIISDWERPAD
jgi:pimeloyl-ACP methyl ester carboxylesterase